MILKDLFVMKVDVDFWNYSMGEYFWPGDQKRLGRATKVAGDKNKSDCND